MENLKKSLLSMKKRLLITENMQHAKNATIYDIYIVGQNTY